MRVLVASTDPSLREALASRLGASAVESDAAIVESLRRGEYDVAVLDRPTGARTLELLATLGTEGLDLPILVVLPRSERAIVSRAYGLGAYECVWRDDLDLERFPILLEGALLRHRSRRDPAGAGARSVPAP